ncbi:MAG: hypothetical protein IJW46_04925 [Clostridia bacterium]|nr:hypothetical protein [Clostridia bacterium]
MNGGEITNNTLASVNCGVIDSVNSSELTPTITIKGGNVTENYAEKDGAAVEVFGSIMDTDRISVSSTAEVSGTLYNYTQVTYLDVTAYIQ